MKKRNVCFAILSAVLIFLLYSNTYHSPFIFDDEKNISSNPYIQINTLSLNKLIDASFKSNAHHRPLANLSFALNYYFHGYSLPGYHLVNIVIHILTGLLLCVFIKLTLDIEKCEAIRHPRENPINSSLIAFCASILWLVHPLHTQSVTYIVQRMNSMAAMFYLASLIMYIMSHRVSGGRRYGWYAGAVINGVLALASKEIAVTLPVFIFLYEWYFFQNLKWSWVKRKLLLVAGIGLFLVGLLFIYTGSNPLNWLLSGYRSSDFTLSQRVMTEWRVMILYITLLFYPNPSRLTLDYDFPLSYSFFNPITTIFSLLFLVGFVILALYLARRERLISFCIFWFLGNLVLESSVIHLELVFEHRTYLPSMMAALLIVVLASRYISFTWVKIVLFCVIIALFSLWTYERNAIWSDELTLWQDCVYKSPKKARTHNNLGVAYVKRKMLNEAIDAYKRSISLNSEYDLPYYLLGNVMYMRGSYNEAIQHYAKALEINPYSIDAHQNMGLALFALQRTDEAIDEYIKGLKINSNSSSLHNNLGIALYSQGKTEQALWHLKEALIIDPGYTDARNNLELITKSSQFNSTF